MNDSNDQTVAGYNKTVSKYIDTSPQKVDGDLKNWIDKNLSKLDQSAKILEIGSGSGKDADYFTSRGYALELTDASRGFVDHLNKTGRNARLLNAITDDLGFGYDMVFADAVFLHFNRVQLKDVLEKVYEALKPSARIAFSLKAGRGEEITERKLDVPRYFCFWEAEDIQKLLTSIGFKDVDIVVIDDYRGKDRPDWLLIDAVRP
ncbi:MAG: class I SAM-dependent methyltransferase [Candidatus Saccharibacteria bacterium]